VYVDGLCCLDMGWALGWRKGIFDMMKVGCEFYPRVVGFYAAAAIFLVEVRQKGGDWVI